MKPSVSAPASSRATSPDSAYPSAACQATTTSVFVLLQTFKDMMRDDFTLFDAYEYTPVPAFLPKGEFPFPIKAKVLKDDLRAKRKHLEAWKAYTSEKLQFEVTENEGNHLFFYQYPERAKWMEGIIKGLPAAFAGGELELS